MQSHQLLCRQKRKSNVKTLYRTSNMPCISEKTGVQVGLLQLLPIRFKLDPRFLQNISDTEFFEVSQMPQLNVQKPSVCAKVVLVAVLRRAYEIGHGDGNVVKLRVH